MTTKATGPCNSFGQHPGQSISTPPNKSLEACLGVFLSFDMLFFAHFCFKMIRILVKIKDFPEKIKQIDKYLL